MNGKVLLSFFAGMIVGGVATYGTLRNATERYISDEIQKFKEEWAESHKTPENGEYEVTEASEEGSKDVEDPTKVKNSIEAGRKHAQEIIQQHNYATAIPGSESAKIPEEEIEKVVPGVKTITLAQFLTERDGYSKETINYLPDAENANDPVGEAFVVDGEPGQPGKVVENGRELIGGLDILDNAEWDDSDAIYVRNELTKTDYEVVKYENTTLVEYVGE